MKNPGNERKTVVYTIGHSTRPISVFVEIIMSYGIKTVVDVRTIPKSRHNPQFNKDALTESLKAVKIGYLHMTGLGGLRHALKNSPNMGWRNASFRGFADYMQTEEFQENIEKLMDAAGKETTVVMCAEAVPWRCHRSLISDALSVSGVHIKHIIGAGSGKDHALTPWAKVNGNRIIYPPSSEPGKFEMIKIE